MAAAGARQVRELDAVLAEQLPGLGHVGDDRLVRVDEVGVCGPRAAVAVDLAPGVAAGHADEAEVAVHPPLLRVHARAQELAGALLCAALAAGVVELQVELAACRPRRTAGTPVAQAPQAER